MSDVFYVLPSAKPGPEATAAIRPWREKGYKVAVFRDAGADACEADWIIWGQYTGWPNAVNLLCRAVLAAYPDVNWLVSAGDDMTPTPDHAPSDVAAQGDQRFGGGPGVIQPTGDRWMPDVSGRVASERINGSPWMNRAFIELMNGEPFHAGYWHMFADEEQHDLTERLGILWQRPDLIHEHHHWAKGCCPKRPWNELATARWDRDKSLFEQRKAMGFPLSGKRILIA